MYFIHPEILWWLFLVLIPIIIHLFNFRRYKKIYFSDIEFLRNISRQTKKQNKLKHLIILFLRMLATAFIVIAFASPRLGEKKTASVSGVKSIYIDNSFSMYGQGEKGMAFEVARNLAGELVKNSEKNTRFLIQTNNFVSGKRLVTQKEAINQINKIKISPVTRKISGILSRQSKILANSSFESYLFSDFQRYATDVNNFNKDTVNYYYFMPVERTQNKNIYIDSCYFEKPLILPGRKAVLKVIVKNASAAGYEKVPLKLFINGKLKSVEGIDLKPYKSKETEFTFIPEEEGWQYGKFSIEDYPVTFDDELYFSFKVKDKLKVLDINNNKPNKYIKSFYSSDSSFIFESRNYLHIDVSSMNKYDAVILDGVNELTSGLSAVLKNYISQGGNVLLIPSENTELKSLNDFLKILNAGNLKSADTTKTRVVSIKKNSSFFNESIRNIPKNASLPSVHFHYPYKYNNVSGVQSLMKILNGDDLLSMKKTGKGRLFILTSPLNKEAVNLMFNPLFVSVMYGVTISNNEQSKLFYFIGSNEKITLPVTMDNSDDIFVLKRKDSDFKFIPGQRKDNGITILTNYDEIEKAGFYEGIHYDSVYFVLAFNYNRNESEMSFYSIPQLDSLLQKSKIKHYVVEQGKINNIRKVINDERKGSQFWKLFIIFALLMLLAEVLILRLWR